MRGSLAALLPVLALAIVPSTAGDLARDEEVRFSPGYAWWDAAASRWRAELRGRVFEPERDSLRRGLLVEALSRSAPPDADKNLFESRARAFLVDAEEGKTVRVRWGDLPARKIRSGEDGEFLWKDSLPDRPATPPGAAISVRAVSGERVFEAPVYLVGPRGPSVVSDIDDTVKISSVTVRSELLANTFFRPGRAVPGMAELYRRWAGEKAVFHYVSNSPWPLEAELREFLGREGFPAGTTHLRAFSPGAELADQLLAAESSHKRDVIGKILGRFPNRRFILVGDSGEKDPEIYGELAREYPRRVTRILIRRVTPDDAERYERAFAGIKRSRWALFDDSAEISSRDLP